MPRMDESCEATSADAFLVTACEERITKITLNRPSRRTGLPPGMPRARTQLSPPLCTLFIQVKPGLFPGQKGAVRRTRLQR